MKNSKKIRSKKAKKAFKTWRQSLREIHWYFEPLPEIKLTSLPEITK